MGRQKKATSVVKIIEGNEPPDYLCEIGRKKWIEVSNGLNELGLLTNLDKDAIGMYCNTYATYINATKAMADAGMVNTSSSGYSQISPYVTIINNSLKTMRSLQTEFGMTPASRGKVKSTKEPDDNFDDFVNG